MDLVLNNMFHAKINFRVALVLIVIITICGTKQIGPFFDDYNWEKYAPTLSKSFYKTRNAIIIGDNLLIYQTKTGGFPKNYYPQTILSKEDITNILDRKTKLGYATIDNGATTLEIRYLANLYNVTQKEEYKNATKRGIIYLLTNQYPNGGWRQCSIPEIPYQSQITYNDNAMLNVLLLLRDVSNRVAPFEFVDEKVAKKAQVAFDKGLSCILKTQVVINGKLTIWGAQHDKNTLKPCIGRIYELPSLATRESGDILIFLMSIENPSDDIKKSIEAGVEWFKDYGLKDKKIEYFNNSKLNKRDYKIVDCQESDNCALMWARFYDLDSMKPIFSGRDGHKLYSEQALSFARRQGYDWYNYKGREVFEAYERWKNSNLSSVVK